MVVLTGGRRLDDDGLDAGRLLNGIDEFLQPGQLKDAFRAGRAPQGNQLDFLFAGHFR